MHRNRLAAGLAAALLLPLGACTDSESKADPPAPTSSAPSPSSSESESEGPALPTEAQGTDEAAAKAFVRFYFELISDAIATGETEQLDELAAQRCKSCHAFIDRIRAIYDMGGRFDDPQRWQLKALIKDPVKDPQRFAFYARVDMPRQRLLDANDNVTAVDEPRMQGIHLVVEGRSGSWAVMRMDLLT